MANYNNNNNSRRDDLNKLVLFLVNESLPGEEWREIAGTEGKYFASSTGRVLSLCRNDGYVLKPFFCGNGQYECVDIKIYGIRKTVRVHRIIADAFIKNYEEKPVVHHKNEIKVDNSVSNLQWATHKENSVYYHENRKLEEQRNGSKSKQPKPEANKSC